MLMAGCEFYPKPPSDAIRSHEYKSGTNDEIRTKRLERMTNDLLMNDSDGLQPAAANSHAELPLFCIANLFMVTF
jgi:hypothetical protein